MKYKAVVIGSSAGGFHALKKIIPLLPADFSLPVLIVQHISPTSDNYMAKYLDKLSQVTVKEADEKEELKPGTVYISPPNYHLLVEEDLTISLSTDPKKNYSRPSIDILFETASYAFGDQLIGIILTGANNDGSQGLKMISDSGGLCIVQNPLEAESNCMPSSAIDVAKPQKVLSLSEIARNLISIDKKLKKSKEKNT